VIAASAFTASLVAHRLFWSSILRDDTLPPRFIFHYPSLSEFGRRIFLTLQSITDSIAGQLHSSTRSGYLAGFIFSVIVAGLLSLFFARRKDAMDVDPYRAQRLCVLLLGIGFLSIGTYVALSVLSGQISGIMPRRYGFGSLSMLTVGGVCVGFVLLRAGHRVYAFAITVAATTFTGQALISEVPFVRSIDRTVMDTLQEKLSSANSVGKGVYFFVGSDVAYEAADAVSSTRGPLMDELPAMDFFQSPLYLYWTAQHYVQYVLKKPFGAMPKSDKGEGTGTPGARPLNVDSGADGVVVANLGLSPLDPAGKNIQIFDSYADFEPNKFSRTIKHEVVGGSRCTNDSFVIDIGSLEATGPGSYVDKEFGADKGRLASWVVDYGYVGVGHAAFEHPDIDSRFFYYKTNRHGSFVYRVVFDSPRYIEASFDFWEQWGRGPGERVFDLDVSWDGERWASVGRIDPASMNGHNAFSIVIVRAKVQSMFFRLVPVRGDVPMLQGLKICRFS
jgi:hypothetical protein